MAIVSHIHPFVIGVDTHARSHTLCVLTPIGEVIDTATFPTTPHGLARLLDWAGRCTGADLAALWVIEGIGSYGAALAALVERAGYPLVEAPALPKRDRGRGKSDPIDAHRIAIGALGLDTTQLRHPRVADGIQGALRILLTARQEITGERTRCINALNALTRTTDLGIDTRRKLNHTQITTIAAWRAHPSDTICTKTARTQAIRLAQRIIELTKQDRANQTQIRQLVQAGPAAILLTKTGIGPVIAATIYTAWSHPGRFRSEAAFAALAGVNPIPVSSGNTHRHRLNRGGDRQLNRALHLAVLTRTRHDPDTRAYITARTTTTTKTERDIRRSLKRYLARQAYRLLKTATTTPQTA